MMTSQSERGENLDKIILALCKDCNQKGITLSSSLEDKKRLMRALENIREPISASEEFLRMEKEELQAQLLDKGIVNVSDIAVSKDGIYLWQGDITRLRVDAIVNAANSQMLGCWAPLHGCIDNAIHSGAGVGLRLACNEVMKGREASTSEVIITPGFNLPSKYVIHTVGPIVGGGVPSSIQRRQLSQCYTSSLDLASKNNLESIAFCCISTGVFGYPADQAARGAVDSVRSWLITHPESTLRTVIFNVFKDSDYKIYNSLI